MTHSTSGRGARPSFPWKTEPRRQQTTPPYKADSWVVTDLTQRSGGPGVESCSRLRRGGHGESTALALGVQTRASIVVAVNELRVLAPRAEDRSEFGAAAKLDLPTGGRVHSTQRTAFGGNATSAERLAL